MGLRCSGLEEDSGKILAGELPVEGSADLLVMILEAEDALGDLVSGTEVVGRECLALKNEAPYSSLMDQSGVLQRQIRGRADLSQLRPQICAASVDLLETAYKTFGRQEFDEFLYRSVAPPIRTWIAEHVDTADALRKKDGGCR